MFEPDIFLKESFARQILLLDECEQASKCDDIAPLMGLVDAPELDESLRQSVADTLISLLRVHTGELLAGLKASGTMRRISIQVSGEKALVEAAEQLGALAEARDFVSEDERIAAYSALTKIGTAYCSEVLARGVLSKDPIIAAICTQYRSKVES